MVLYVPSLTTQEGEALRIMANNHGARFRLDAKGNVMMKAARGKGMDRGVMDDAVREHFTTLGLLEYPQPGHVRISYLGRAALRKFDAAERAVRTGYNPTAPLDLPSPEFLALVLLRDKRELGLMPNRPFYAKGPDKAPVAAVEALIARGLAEFRGDRLAVRITERGRQYLARHFTLKHYAEAASQREADEALNILDTFKGRLGPKRQSILRACQSFGPIGPQGYVNSEVYCSHARPSMTFGFLSVEWLLDRGLLRYSDTKRGIVVITPQGTDILKKLERAQRAVRAQAALPQK